MATMMRTFAPSSTADATIGETTGGTLLGTAEPPSAPATLDELLLVRLIGKLASGAGPDGGELGQLLRRCRKLVGSCTRPAFCVTQEGKALIDAARAILASAQPDPSAPLCPILAQTTSDLLAQTAGAYRWSYRRYGSSGQLAELPAETVRALLNLSERYMDASSARQ